MRPVLPRNQQKPMKRTMERAPVANSRNLKNQAVRADAVFYADMLVNCLSEESL